MENETKLALFVGGIADGKTKEIGEPEPRLNYHGVIYALRGKVETKEFGTAQIYALESMKVEETARRIEKLK